MTTRSQVRLLNSALIYIYCTDDAYHSACQWVKLNVLFDFLKVFQKPLV